MKTTAETTAESGRKRQKVKNVFLTQSAAYFSLSDCKVLIIRLVVFGRRGRRLFRPSRILDIKIPATRSLNFTNLKWDASPLLVCQEMGYLQVCPISIKQAICL